MADYPRCRTCRWWDRDGESPDYVHKWAYENGLKLTQCHEHRRCNSPMMQGIIATSSSVIYEPDDPYCKDTTFTGPDFGCINHDPTEPHDAQA